MTRYSRSIWCALAERILPGGFFRSTYFAPVDDVISYVGLDCPWLNCVQWMSVKGYPRAAGVNTCLLQTYRYADGGNVRLNVLGEYIYIDRLSHVGYHVLYADVPNVQLVARL